MIIPGLPGSLLGGAGSGGTAGPRFQCSAANSRPAGLAVEGDSVYILDESEAIYVYSRGGVPKYQVRVPRSLVGDSLWPSNGAMGGVFTTGPAYPWLGVVATRKRASDNHVQYGLTWYRIDRATGNLTYLKTEALAEIADDDARGAPDNAVGCTADTDLAGNANRGNLYVLGANSRFWRFLLDENTDDVAASPQVRAASKAPNAATDAGFGIQSLVAMFHATVPMGSFGNPANRDAYNTTDAFCFVDSSLIDSSGTGFISVRSKPYSYGPFISARYGRWHALTLAECNLVRGAAADQSNDVWFVLSDGRVLVRPFVLPPLFS